MDEKKLEAQIRKTGFVLEDEIAQVLKSTGWTVISNKYYVDDFENSVREIDLVAYKASPSSSAILAVGLNKKLEMPVNVG